MAVPTAVASSAASTIASTRAVVTRRRSRPGCKRLTAAKVRGIARGRGAPRSWNGWERATGPGPRPGALAGPHFGRCDPDIFTDPLPVRHLPVTNTADRRRGWGGAVVRP